MKKLFCLILSTVLAVSFVACTKNNSPAATSEPQNSAAPSETKAPEKNGDEPPFVTDGSVTLTIGTKDNYFESKSYTLNLPIWQEIEKKTGIKINWDVVPNAQYNDSMRTRLAAASNLPDIIGVPFDDPVKLGLDGLVLPMNDLIEKYAPNIKEYFKQFPGMERVMRAPDGEIYGLSSVVDGAGNADPYGLLIRQDWLDKLGLKEPTTLDEWYTVLKAFKEKDPNGNGKQDEIPFTPGGGLSKITLFGSALGLHLYMSDNFFPDANGKIQYQWFGEGAKELVVWFNKLHQEGLLGPNFLNYSGDQQNADIAQNLLGATNGFANATARFNKAQIAAGVTDAEWTQTVPPSSPGHKGFYDLYGPISGWFSITKDTKNPEMAMRWLDYVYASQEGNYYATLGIEGTSYTIVNGEPVYTDFLGKNPDGLSSDEALRSLGALPNIPYIRSTEGPLSKNPIANLNLNPTLAAIAQKMKPYSMPSSSYMVGLPSAEEVEELSKLNPDIDTYVNETLSKFISGQSPIDWDTFTSTLKSLGIEKVVQVWQNRYDRFNQ